MTGAVAQLHGVLGAAALVLFVLLAVGSLGAVAARSELAVLDGARRIGLVLAVVQVAIGLAVYFRGARPAEAIHWLYGGVIVLVLLAPSSVTVTSDGARRGLLAGSAVLAAVFAWRLWGSG